MAALRHRSVLRHVLSGLQAAVVGSMMPTAAWAQSKMPPCPATEDFGNWDRCFGEHLFSHGNQKYVGEWQDGKRNGHGTLTSPDGTKYVGEWKDGKRTGYGIQYAPPGRIFTSNGQAYQSGMWANDQFVGAAVASPYNPLVSAGHNEIQLIKQGGIFTVPVLINGIIPLYFTVDSGAADVSIPVDVFLTLVRTGTISDDDFLGDQTYVLADGSRVKSKTFRIRKLKVGDRVVENVKGSIAGVNGTLLLGQSFLSRFKSVKFDYTRGVLGLE